MRKALELAKSASSILYSQANTWRWPGRHTIGKQNIAEHHTVVAQLVLLILDEYNVPEEYHVQALRRAITHDLPESLTNDIPYVIKRDFPEFAKAYDLVEEHIEKSFPLPLQNSLEKESIPWLVVKLADSLDVYLFTGLELDLGSANEEMHSIYSQSQLRVAAIEDRLQKKLGELS